MTRLPHTLAATAALTVLVMTGCQAKLPLLAPKPEPIPTVVRLEMSADTTVNTDRRGRATPIVVRYYLLQNTAAFDSADFFSLFERDEAVLGAAKVVREEIPLPPGQAFNAELKPQGEAKFLAVFAAYRDVNTTGWRATAPVPQNKTTVYTVRVGQNGIAIGPKSP